MTTNPTPFDTSDAAEHAGAPASSPGVDPGQPVAAVREAYWYGTRLIHHGWIIRRVGATGRGGFFVAETPRGRAVTVGTDHRCAVSDDLAAQFADSITVLAAAGSEDNHDYLRDLVLLLGAHPGPAAGETAMAHLAHSRCAGVSAARGAGARRLLVRGHADRRLRLGALRDRIGDRARRLCGRHSR